MQTSLKLLASKALTMGTARQSVIAASHANKVNMMTMYAYPQRYFSPPKKGRKGKKKADAGEASEGETTDAGDETQAGVY